MPLRVQHILPRKTLKNGLRFPGEYMLCSQRLDNLYAFFYKNEEPSLTGRLFI